MVQVFEPVWRQHPAYLPLALAVGLALVHNSQSAQGIEVLRDALQRHPDSVEAWDGWLTGLDEGFQPDLLRQEFARLPGAWPPTRGSPSMKGTWRRRPVIGPEPSTPTAAPMPSSRSTAWCSTGSGWRCEPRARQPSSTVPTQLLTDYQNAFKQMRSVYAEAYAIKTLGLEPHPELYHRLAGLREQMGRFDEARAWHRLVLGDIPDDALEPCRPGAAQVTSKSTSHHRLRRVDPRTPGGESRTCGVGPSRIGCSSTLLLCSPLLILMPPTEHTVERADQSSRQESSPVRRGRFPLADAGRGAPGRGLDWF